MSLSGRLHIRLQPAHCEQRVLINMHMPQSLSRLFCGKPLAQVVQTIPLLFNLCRRVQAVVAVRAAEQALGIVADDDKERARDCLVRYEMLHEHCWHLLQVLPTVLGLPAQKQCLTVASRQLTLLMNRLDERGRLTLLSGQACDDAVLSCLQAAREVSGQWVAELRHRLFGDKTGPKKDSLPTPGAAGLASRMLEAAAQLDWPTNYVPKAPMHDRITDCADPHSGDALETGALVRAYSHPQVVRSRERSGNGLVTRLMALLVETDQLLGDITSVSLNGSAVARGPGHGLCVLDTARGQLRHELRLSTDPLSTDQLSTDRDQSPVVTWLQLISPTDCHFHATGAAATLLQELLRNADDRLEQRATVLVKLLNPCVEHSIEVPAGRAAVVDHA